MPDPRLIRLSGPLSHCYEEKMEKRLIDLRKVENDGIDALKARSIKNAKSLLEYSTRSLRLLLLSTQKRSMTRKC